jgi:hypothetical protein
MIWTKDCSWIHQIPTLSLEHGSLVLKRMWKSVFKSLNTPSEYGKSNCGGIDSLNLSAVMSNDAANLDGGVAHCSDINVTLDPFKGEDPTSKISCERCFPCYGKSSFFATIHLKFRPQPEFDYQASMVAAI